jgi:superfamily I DNA/RNA helicase
MIVNQEQEEAINCDSRNILVLAGAGSGKTKTLIDKIKYYINEKRASPKNILAITFTKDAISEIQDRLIEYTDRTNKYQSDLQQSSSKSQTREKYISTNSVLKSLTVRTFHSLCFSILRENGASFFDNRFRILREQLSTLSDLQADGIASKETVASLLRKSIIAACEQENGFMGKLERYLIENNPRPNFAYSSKSIDYESAYFTKSGVAVKSKSEQRIADWFFDKGYEIEYEPHEIAKSFRFSPDFKLNTKDFYIEHKSNISYPLHDKLKALAESGKPVFITHESWMHDSRKIEAELMNILRYAYDGNYSVEFSKLFDNRFRLLSTPLDRFLRDLKQAYDLAKSQGLSFNEVASLESPLFSHSRIREFYKLFPMVWKHYEMLKKKHSVVDFNDLLTLTVELLRTNDEVRAFYQKKFLYILVDEFQDVNPSQVMLLKLLYTNETNLFCVGDDWQSIYGFRGSDVSYIIDFEKHFPESTTVKLKYNFRSTENIVKVGEKIISYNKNKVEKDVLALKKSDQKVSLFKANTAHDTLGFLAERIAWHLKEGTKPSEILILGRRTAHFQPFVDPLKSQGVRFNTIHSSKGLEAKVVFITGLTHGSGGFPDTWLEDSIYQVLKQTNKSILLEEERRLFYVAITRAKDYLYLLTERGLESEFIENLPKDFIDEEVALF